MIYFLTINNKQYLAIVSINQQTVDTILRMNVS